MEHEWISSPYDPKNVCGAGCAHDWYGIQVEPNQLYTQARLDKSLEKEAKHQDVKL